MQSATEPSCMNFHPRDKRLLVFSVRTGACASSHPQLGRKCTVSQQSHSILQLKVMRIQSQHLHTRPGLIRHCQREKESWEVKMCYYESVCSECSLQGNWFTDSSLNKLPIFFFFRIFWGFSVLIFFKLLLSSQFYIHLK